MSHRTLRHSQSQQNMQTISETPAEALQRVNKELHSLLLAAAGDPGAALHTSISRWRQRVGSLIAEATAIAANALQSGGVAAAKPFVQTQYSSGGGQALALGTDIVFDEAGYGLLPYDNSTGEFTLQANKSYRLTGHFALGNYSGETVNVGIEWVDAATNTVLHAGHVALCTPVDNTNSLNPQPTADTFHQTAAAQTVKLRVTSTLGTADALGGLCSALVQEI